MLFSILFTSLLLVSMVYLLFLFIFYKSRMEMEIISSYECGFNPGISSRLKFSYRFFLISILFIIFDVEIALLLPIPFISGSIIMLWLFMMFMWILVCGLLYEYMWGSLDWLD